MVLKDWTERKQQNFLVNNKDYAKDFIKKYSFRNKK
jgi:hypothetical protein